MGAVTYPAIEVQEFFNDNFTCFKLNTKDKGNPDRKILARRILSRGK